jgi:uncharacterized protein YqgC (DUF456 family)
MVQVLTWCLTVVLMLAGLAGVVVPLLPGTLLILLGAVAHKLMLPGDLSWMALAWIAGFWVVSMLADVGGVLLGTRWFGGSKWGMTGAGGGALIGVFFSLPALVLGTVLGAVVAEKLIAKRSGADSLRAGVGAATGFVISTLARLACAMVMIGLFVAAVAGSR